MTEQGMVGAAPAGAPEIDGRAGARAARRGELPLLEVLDLYSHFFTNEGIVKAVDGASFSVRRGRTLGIVGESGCGKSVAAKSILQIIEKPGRIVSGQMLFRPEDDGNELDILTLAPDSQQMRDIRGGSISMIFQEPMTSFSPVHTIGNQITEAIRLHRKEMGKKEAWDLAVEWLRRVGMPNPAQRLSDYPYQLSGGQRQRAMIAMALCTGPQMLIADEPTTALDVTTQAGILNLLQDLQEEHNMAVLFITHDLGVIAEVADDVVVMYLGRVVEKAPVEKIFTSPQHPYTRALMQSIPTIYSEPRERLPSITGSIPHPQNRPPGCPFHPRCPSYMPGICEQREPRLTKVDADQEAACFLYEGA